MELWKEIIKKAIQNGEWENYAADEAHIAEVLQSECYIALAHIRDIVRDDTLQDEECFMRIEEIVCTLERLGSNGGSRHDF